MNKSESIANLSKAVSELQGELVDAKKNATNPHFKSQYADLSEVLGNIRPLLAKHKLALMQFPGYENGIVTVTTLLSHVSGEFVESTASAPIGNKQDAQGVGSALTYLKRYSAASIVGMASADIDDDGNSASTPAAPSPVKSESKKSLWTDLDEIHLEKLFLDYAIASKEALKMTDKDIDLKRKNIWALKDTTDPIKLCANIQSKTRLLEKSIADFETSEKPKAKLTPASATDADIPF